MWIVRLALRRPYTFAVLALVLLILGPLVALTTPTDIFPAIDIPVVAMVWQYTGLSPQQMANRITVQSERSLTTTVNNIEHIESQSLNGIAVIKIFFQPKVNIANAVAQVTAIAQTQVRQLPPGTTPPLILQYNASSVPIIQLGLSGEGLSEQQLNDFGLNTIRTQLVTVDGAGIPYPYGGKQRQVQVDLNLPALQAKGLSPVDVVNTIAAQNVILPSGTAKIGPFEYEVETNSTPLKLDEINNLPIRASNGAVIYIHDVAHVRDGFPPQTNIVRVDGQRASLLSVIKTGDASTLDIVQGIRDKVEIVKPQVPPNLKITPLADQSLFVRAAIDGVVREAIIAACLTALMILIFLGSWRSTVIIAVSIPLAILSSLIALSALGETINIMTLGGLALAVGILVDDATVEIENINRNVDQGKDVVQAILDGAQQIAVPALVSTIAICIVFVPMFFLSGVAKFLFVPLAEAVCFAMIASYILSRTVVPTMAKYLLRGHEHEAAARERAKTSRNVFIRFQAGFERGFDALRLRYHGLLELCQRHAKAFLFGFLGLTVASAALLYPFLGQDFFPSVDSGQFKIHLRAHTGTRIEDVASLCDQVDRTIRELIPPDELVTIIDNIGLPYSGINTTYSNSAPIGPGDADIQVSLAAKHRPTPEYVQHLREELHRRFPGRHVLRAAGRHRHADPELRPPGAPRHPGRRQRPGRQPRLGRTRARPREDGRRHRRPAHPAAVRRARPEGRRRPHEGAADGPVAARRRDQPADRHQRQLPDLPQLLAQPAERRQLQHRRAGAAVPDGHAAGSRKHPAGHAARRRPPTAPRPAPTQRPPAPRPAAAARPRS